jgi:nicotinate-nucleotide pyrophosphorylase (carboxylating)
MPPAPPHPATWLALLERALAEDLGSGDVTTRAVLPEDTVLEAVIEARAEATVCGLEVASRVFEAAGDVHVTAAARDGDRARAGAPLLRLSGSAHAILAGERTALNFLGRLTGVSTWTRRFVDAVAGTGTQIVDTRKTLPGWRVLDKYAVAVGGGVNHRAGLYDAALIKDNHVAAAGGVEQAVKAARAALPAHLWLQVEVETREQAQLALDAGADSLLLDNQSTAQLRALVEEFSERTLLEASGGISLANVREIAETGVQRISIGALTHSAPHADVALEVTGGGLARPGAGA